MTPPVGSVTSQSHELQMGTNVLGPWLFTELLTPLLRKTASSRLRPCDVGRIARDHGLPQERHCLVRRDQDHA
jgi:NAD(P)-dependent dehydrogenase (short-subunit alcohol dehydrogenase family)